MALETIWSLIGITVSIVFGSIGIYLTVKNRYAGGITFLNENTIELFDAIGNSLDKLSVTYDGTSVNENLILLNGAFINSGKFDITEDMIEQPITLKLPHGYKWLTGRVISSKVKADLIVDSDRFLSISTGLFRCGECVRFHALAQLPDNDGEGSKSDRFNRSLTFEHRIVNTKNIDEVKILSRKEIRRNFKRMIPHSVIVILMLFSCIFVSYKGFPKGLAYPYDVHDGVVENVTIKTTTSEIVDVVSIDSDFEIEEEFSEFILKVKGDPYLVDRNNEVILLYVMFFIQLIMVSFLVLSGFYENYRNKKFLKILMTDHN